MRLATIRLITLWAIAALLSTSRGSAQVCVECHKKVTPNIVVDWQLSKHSQNSVDCSTCHGEKHNSAANARNAVIPTPETCGQCHEEKVKQFTGGKHAAAWAAMKAMPTAHFQPMYLMDGMKGCGGCHKIGLKTEAETKELKTNGGGFGLASCDACHTRHTFSAEEARQPEACQTCHIGFDHPQYEMYTGSKHGVRRALRSQKILPATAPAPSCQTCHMQGGNHEVRTAWGFLAVRLPMPEDTAWAEDRSSILQALGVLDPLTGKPTARLDVVKNADMARLTAESWQNERDKMVRTCGQCHSDDFAKGELMKSDNMIKAADRLMAEAIREVASLYKDSIIPQPKSYASAFPDLLTFHDAPTEIEQKLFVMFLEHRMRTFQGSFHMNPDYAIWYGWSAMQMDLTEIKNLAADLRRRAGKKE